MNDNNSFDRKCRTLAIQTTVHWTALPDAMLSSRGQILDVLLHGFHRLAITTNSNMLLYIMFLPCISTTGWSPQPTSRISAGLQKFSADIKISQTCKKS